MTFRPLPDDGVCRPYMDSHIMVVLESDYILENITGSEHPHEVKSMHPLPAEKALRGYAGIKSVSIGDSSLNAEQIKEGIDRIPDTDYEKCASWPVQIGTDRPLLVKTRAHLIKEKSDNEVWSSLLPTISLEVIVDMQLDDLSWNINSLHSGNLKAIDGPDEGPRGREKTTFRTQNPVLPYQGVLVWWRPKGEIKQVPQEDH